MQMMVANIPGAVLSQWRGHMVPRFHTLLRHMEMQTFSCAVCLRWRGVTKGALCEKVCVCEICTPFVFFLSQHIAWFLGTVICPHGACHLRIGLCVCHSEADWMGLRGPENRERRGGYMTEEGRVGIERYRRCDASLKHYPVLSFDVVWIQVAILKLPWLLVDQE